MDECGLTESTHDVVTVRTRRDALTLAAVGLAGVAVAAPNLITEAKHGKRHKGHKGHKGHHRHKRRHGGGGNGGGDGDGGGGQTGGPAQRPFPQHLTYAAGTIRPNHRSQAQQDDDLRAAYGRWKDRYLVNESSGGQSLYRVAFGGPGSDKHNETVSEGQGYGMIIVPLFAGYDPDAQTIFDGLWRFARNHPSSIDSRLMDWKVPGGDGNDSAFDGDCDMAYGLLLANAQWGSGGATDYSAAANQLLAGILASTIGPNSRLPLLGDWVPPFGAPKYTEWTPRTSDFMPGHFRAFRRFTGDPVWDQVVGACQGVVSTLQQNNSPGTGLLPDFVQFDGSTPRPASPGFLEGPNDGNYNYNAGRDPWRLGTDALLSGDGTSLAQTRKISQWIAGSTGGNPQALKSGYQLDGTPLSGSNYFSTFFAAPFGVAAMTDSGQQSWLNAIYDAVINSNEGYYEDSVALICSLVLSGNFWDPTV
jgi:endo-1,4-beta-D-glucanase Y